LLLLNVRFGKGVVVLDSPIVAGWRAFLLRIFKAFDLDKKVSPARFAEKRRHIWKDKEAAYQHFAAKEYSPSGRLRCYGITYMQALSLILKV
jgi:hypothetical protein